MHPPTSLDIDLEGFMSRLVEFLPGFLFQVGHWLYDWQVLLASILVLVSAHIWGRSVIRAAELRSQATLAPQTSHAYQEPAGSQARRRTTGPNGSGWDLRAAEQGNAAVGPRENLLRLRAQIRGVLARVPCVDDPLTPSQLKDCQNLGNNVLETFAFPKDDLVRNEFALVQKDLSELDALKEGTTCRTAWNALIALNNSTRGLELCLGEGSLKARVGAGHLSTAASPE